MHAVAPPSQDSAEGAASFLPYFVPDGAELAVPDFYFQPLKLLTLTVDGTLRLDGFVMET